MLNQVIQTVVLSNPKIIYTDGLLLYKLLIHKTIHKVTRFGTNRINLKHLYPQRKERKIPNYLTFAEITKLIVVITNIKHKSIIMLL